MKKTSFILVILFLTLALSGCGRQEAPIQTNMDNNQQASSSELASSSRLTPESDLSTTSSSRVIPGQKDLYQKYKEAIIKTNLGDIAVEFYGDESPITVNNFMNLASTGFYNNTKFHRVIKDFMIQGGDPNSKGSDLSTYGIGGPGYSFNDEFNNHKLVRGSLAMANSGPDTNGSQFFIVTKESTPWLDGKHTNFGRIISGMKVVDKIEGLSTDEADRPTKEAFIKSIELK